MLGFGDVILPALLVGYALAFDLVLQKHNFVSGGRLSRYRYWIVSVTAYAAGMIVTFIAMALTRRPQPALLYLVPL